MLSLSLYVVIIVSEIALMGYAFARAAHAVGSPRGRFRVGLAIAIVLFVLGLAFAWVVETITPATGRAELIGRGVLALLFQMGLTVIALSAAFRLTAVRTLAPLGAGVAVCAAYLAAIALVIRPHVTEAFNMPAGGMSPTLLPGDRFFVNRVSTPRRWDLVAYRTTERDKPVVYCKRLVGLGGERLRFQDGQLYVNDVRQQAPAVVAGRYAAGAGAEHSVGPYRDGETIQLGPDQVFFVGDNVNQSSDSRVSGPSAAGDVVGVVDLLYWPPGRIRIAR